ncbi:methyltransferase domain-containing protein [uncultured Limosilactobacillus sp.]|uniref:methyltransferase domain-containing protein n=1 Tax=uncultured Limosilactobacillus sp. TaxID=2837629 RepID=UPI00265E0895|nr:methyltransferase domain-containing protein [uncultured Limosilactobacillus sp.]
MKKVERQRELVKSNIDLFQCPVCEQPMKKVEGNSLVCINNHRFDFNRHGYLHFLNGAANTEYGREMFNSRRQLLNAGLFSPIIEGISKLLPAKSMKILDVGTGEGTPLMQLNALRLKYSDTMIGFDISKSGITLATQLPLAAFFCVADLRKLPFTAQSFDLILELFSPSDYQEFNRVLKNNGMLIKVIPNANYLIELRHLLYQDGERNYQYDNSRVVELFKQHYPNSQIKKIKYRFDIPNGLQGALLEMTPLHWGENAKKLSQEELEQLTTITVDVSLLITKKS